MIVNCKIYYFDNVFSILEGLNLKREFREKFKIVRVMDFKGDTLDAITDLLNDQEGKWLVLERNFGEIMIIKLEENMSNIDQKLVQDNELSKKIEEGRE